MTLFAARLTEVDVERRSPDRLVELLGEERAARFLAVADATRARSAAGP